MWLRELLNERKWRHDDLHTLQLVVLHRGAPADQVQIDGIDILEICPGGLFVAADDARIEWESELVEEDERKRFLPWHRILEVRGPSGSLWTRGD